jgi:hypothetical protein
MIVQREPVAPIQEVFSSPDGLACPVCHRDDRTDKVSSIIRRETGQVIAVGAGSVFAFHTALSRALAPPQPPQTEPWDQLTRQILIVWLLLAIIAGVALLSPLPEELSIPSGLITIVLGLAVICFGLVHPILSAWRLYRAKQAEQRNLPLWAQARDRWSRLYYCSRDDVVYVAWEERYETPDQILDLLYRRDAPVPSS